MLTNRCLEILASQRHQLLWSLISQGNLRRLVYLFLKEVADHTDPSDLLIVTASLVKDMNDTDIALFRANAIRVLCKIVDANTLGSIDRYLRQAIVDKGNEYVNSSAILAAYHMMKVSLGPSNACIPPIISHSLSGCIILYCASHLHDTPSLCRTRPRQKS